MSSLTLVTGSSGFIGKNFLSVHNSKDLTILARKKPRINVSCNLFFADLFENETFNKIKKMKIEELVHFAWFGLPDTSKESNIKNQRITKRLIDSVLEGNPDCKLYLMGSCLEYGDLIGKVKETSQPLNLGHFGETKLNVLDYVQKATQNFVWFRIFYAYGPNQHKNALINYCYENLKKGQVPILLKPNDSHDFIYIKDVAKIISRSLIDKNVKGIINVGSGILTSNSEVLSSMAIRLGLDSKINKEMKYNGLVADNSRLKKYFQDFKFTSLTKGIDNFLLESHD